MSHQKSPNNTMKEPLLDEPKTPVHRPDPKHTNKIVIRKLMCVFLLSFTFMLIEIVGGIFSNSLAILADAGHLLSDLLGFAISIVSVWITSLPADRKHTYGFHRAGVIGALASVMIIWGLTGFLVYYAIQRVINIDSIHVDGKIMFGTACFGLMTNIIMIKVLNWESSLEKDIKKAEREEAERQLSPNSEGKRVIDIENKRTQIDYEYGLEGAESDELDNVDDTCNNQFLSPLKPEELPDTEVKKRIKAQKSLVDTKGAPKYRDNQVYDHEVAVKTVGGQGTKTEETVEQNFNIRATVIHIIGDMIQSIGVIIAAALIWYNPTQLKIADPIVTFIFSVIVICTTLRITKDCIVVLMEAIPSEINIDELEEKILMIKGVIDIHDFHIWSLSEGKSTLSMHIHTNEDSQSILKKVTKVCRLYGIFHTTIQVETVQDIKHHNYVSCEHDIH